MICWLPVSAMSPVDKIPMLVGMTVYNPVKWRKVDIFFIDKDFYAAIVFGIPDLNIHI